jgi:hypothetical protein
MKMMDGLLRVDGFVDECLMCVMRRVVPIKSIAESRGTIELKCMHGHWKKSTRLGIILNGVAKTVVDGLDDARNSIVYVAPNAARGFCRSNKPWRLPGYAEKTASRRAACRAPK